MSFFVSPWSGGEKIYVFCVTVGGRFEWAVFPALKINAWNSRHVHECTGRLLLDRLARPSSEYVQCCPGRSAGSRFRGSRLFGRRGRFECRCSPSNGAAGSRSGSESGYGTAQEEGRRQEGRRCKWEERRGRRQGKGKEGG
jgi:hypothetical protein